MFTFYSRILVAYDGSELGKEALATALKLAEQDERIEVHVLYVSKPAPVILAGYEAPAVYRIEELEQEQAQKIETQIKNRIADVKNKTNVVVLKGNPAELIVSYAKEQDCDLIVMGSRGLSNLKEFFLGSVSHNVVQQAHCPVLIVK